MSYPNINYQNSHHRSHNSKVVVATKRKRDLRLKRKSLLIKKLLKERYEMNKKIERLESLVA